MLIYETKRFSDFIVLQQNALAGKICVGSQESDGPWVQLMSLEILTWLSHMAPGRTFVFDCVKKPCLDTSWSTSVQSQ